MDLPSADTDDEEEEEEEGLEGGGVAVVVQVAEGVCKETSRADLKE